MARPTDPRRQCDVYSAWRILLARGPSTSIELEKAILPLKDWDVLRIARVVRKLATCGYVDVDSAGVMTAREAAR